MTKEDLAARFYGLPKFHVTRTETHQVGSCVAVYAFFSHGGGEEEPLYTAIMEAKGMLEAGREAADTSLMALKGTGELAH